MIGERVRKFRLRKRYTLSELSEMTGISKSYLSNIERGIQKNPSLKVLSQIAANLEVSLEDLLDKDLKKKALEHEWFVFLQEVQELNITKEEFAYTLELIKFNRKHLYRGK